MNQSEKTKLLSGIKHLADNTIVCATAKTLRAINLPVEDKETPEDRPCKVKAGVFRSALQQFKADK